MRFDYSKLQFSKFLLSSMPYLLSLWLCLVLAGMANAAESPAAQFVDNASCGECHQPIFEQWRQSHHAKSMQPATADTVLGNFDDVRFTANGVESRFFRRDGRYFVHTEGGDGQYADFEVKYTFGFTPLQQYLLELPKGRLQAFTVAWDSVGKRWFGLYPDARIPPGDPLHWSGRRFTWNSSCAECHSTDLRLNYDPDSAGYRTSWAEINVSCQACHGPGSRHLAWARDPKRKPQGNKGWPLDLKTLRGPAQVEACGPCHARRYSLSLDDRPGRPLLDDFMPELLGEGLYHPDGQMQDEVFNYGSFLQSKMYQKGIGCLDCHQAHTLGTRRAGNALCTGCHQPQQRAQGKPPAKTYDAPSHHFHRPGSSGAQCVNCHAPPQTYMVVDPRHDHGFRVPRPDLSAQLGVPNACNQCHADQTADWALAKMREWYGSGWQRPQYGSTLAAGRAGQPEAQQALTALAKDQAQPAIVRATALDLLRRYGEPARATHAALLGDAAPLVRVLAARGLEPPRDPKHLAGLPRLLQDPVRAVRMEAARVLATTPAAVLSARERAALATALEEYKTAQLAADDQPEGQANLGVLYAAMNQPEAAERAYRAAIARDADFVPAYSNLAGLYHRLGRKAEAEQTFRAGLGKAADAATQGMLHYSLGLLLAEQARLKEAAESLGQAAALLPDEPRVRYNQGLLLQKLGQFPEAETALRRAVELSPQDPDPLYALVAYYLNRHRPAEALPYAERLQRDYPQVPEFRKLLDSLRGR